MKIIVAGGTGFVGNALMPGLIKDGHDIIILRRPGSQSHTTNLNGLKVEFINPEQAFQVSDLTADVVINLVGIIRENPGKGSTYHRSHFLVTRNLVDYARLNGIKRFLQMSALGVRPDSNTEYFRTKFEAENYVKESGLDWTIFRPAIIIGPESHFISLLSNMVRKFPVVPVVGDGRYKIQMVHIADICAGFRTALLEGRSIGKTFEIGSPDILSYDETLEIIGMAIGKSRVRKIHQPLRLIRSMAAIFGRFSWFPITNDQITMLLESNYTNEQLFWEMFNLTPKRFAESMKEDI